MINENRQLPQLPEGWVWTNISTIGEISSGYGFPKKYQGKTKGEFPFFKVMDISKAFLAQSIYLKDADNYISVKECGEIKAQLLKAGTIVFAKIGEAIKLNRRAILYQDSLVDNNVMGIYPLTNAVDNQFVFYLLLTIKLGDYSRATTVPSVRKTDVEQILIPLPPLPEQHRIVTKMEELFTRLDAGIEALNRIKLQLKAYRQAVLKHAFEGKLTEEWRESHKSEIEPAYVLLERIREERRKNARGKFKELPPVDTSDLPELPEGWVWATFEGIATNEKNAIVDGPFGSNLKVSDYIDDENGVPVLTTRNLERGYDKQYLRYISMAKFQKLKRSEVKGGDILVAKIGSCGKSAIYPEDGKPAMIPANLLKMTVHPEVQKLYIFYFLGSPFLKMELRQITTATAQPAFNVTKFRNLAVPLPPIPEQYRIVEETERRFSVADEIEKVIEQSLMQAERLRQSILKRAFEGKLVPQDPHDEPAEKLLERIKAEKARRD